MNESWRQFLQGRGARIEGERVDGFSDPTNEANAAANGNMVCDLSHFGLIRAKGDDARNFLHNQFSNDVNHLDESRSELNSYNTPKGRMMALFRMFVRGGDIYLRVPADTMEPFFKRLSMFVLMSKVTLSDAGDELCRIGLSGEAAAEALSAHIGTLPSDDESVVSSDDLTVLRVPGYAPRFEVYGPESAIQVLWESLPETIQPVGWRAWALLDIRAGQPNIFDATREAFVPQMVNLELVGGVSFKKGCYPGQEVVARMQYLGKLKRRMLRAVAVAERLPTPGDSLFSATSKSEQGAGTVVDAQPGPDGNIELLAVVELENAKSGTINLNSVDGPALSFVDLPYDFPTAEASA